MRSIPARVFCLLTIGALSHAANIVSSPQAGGFIGQGFCVSTGQAGNNRVAAASWTMTSGASNVVITAQLGDTGETGTTVTAYLSNAVGTGATPLFTSTPVTLCPFGKPA